MFKMWLLSYECVEHNKKLWSKRTTLAGLEPTRNNSNRFLVGRLNHSAIVSSTLSPSVHDNQYI